MGRGWCNYALFLIALICLIVSDQVLRRIVSPLDLVSESSGIFSTVDRHLSFVSELRAREKALDRIHATTDPVKRLQLTYQLLKTIQSGMKNEHRSSESEPAPETDIYRELLEDTIAEQQNQPAVVDAIVMLLALYQSEGNIPKEVDLLRQATRLIQRPETPADDSERIALIVAKAATDPALARERFQFLRRAALRNANSLPIHELLFVAAEALHETQESEQVRKHLDSLRTYYQGERNITYQLSSINLLLSSASFESADKEAERFRASLNDPKLVLRFDAAYCALLDERKCLDKGAMRLENLLRSQEALLPDKGTGIPQRDGIRLILAGFEYAFRQGDLPLMKTATRLCEAFAPAYLPWFQGEVWLAEGRPDPAVKTVLDIPVVDASGLVCDAKRDESVWNSALRIPGPYHHYPCVNIAAEFDTKGTYDPDIRVFCDADGFSFFMVFPEPHPERITATRRNGEVDVWRDESVECFFFPERSLRHYVQVIITASGAATVLAANTVYFMNDHVEPGAPDDPELPEGLAIATGRDGKSWMIECHIPYARIGFSADEAAHLDGFALRRNRYIETKNGICEAWSLTTELDSTHYQQTQLFFQRKGRDGSLPTFDSLHAAIPVQRNPAYAQTPGNTGQTGTAGHTGSVGGMATSGTVAATASVAPTTSTPIPGNP